MPLNLKFLAGEKALALIRKNGLDSEMVDVIAGAAGGPKWLTLARLDRSVFIDFIKTRTRPLFLMGASIGTWRFSTVSQKNPLKAHQNFENSYLNQRYSNHPTAKEVTLESRKILDSFLEDTGVDEILTHPFLRLNFLSVRCKGLLSSSNNAYLGAGLFASFLLNVFSKKFLRFFFERVLFYHPKNMPPFFNDGNIPALKIKLARDNLKTAIMSSGSIPMVMEGIVNPPWQPKGVYRDGGIVDYHLDIPFNADENKIVLYPHFSQRIIPGWMDKKLPWRKPNPSNFSNVLLVCPTDTYIKNLPNGKIPDRNDFKLYLGRDEERIDCWKTVIQKSESLAEEFLETVAADKIKERVKPLFLNQRR